MVYCKIYNRDCASLEEVEDSSVRLVFTSPPDAIQHRIGFRASALNRSLLYSRGYIIDLALPFLRPLANEIYRVLRDDGVAIINIGSPVRDLKLSSFEALNPLLFAEHIVQCSPLSLVRDFLIVQAGQAFVADKDEFKVGIVSLHQHLLMFAKDPEKLRLPHGDEPIPSVWSYALPTVDEGRRTQFSLSVTSKVVETFTDEADIVLDPMAGVGTLGAVAARKGRDSILYEIDPNLIPLIEKNMASTGANVETFKDVNIESAADEEKAL